MRNTERVSEWKLFDNSFSTNFAPHSIPHLMPNYKSMIRKINMYPPYLGAGIRVKSFSNIFHPVLGRIEDDLVQPQFIWNSFWGINLRHV